MISKVASCASLFAVPVLPFSFCRILSLMVLVCAVTSLAVSTTQTSDRATIAFRNVFKSGNPEFIEIKVRENGSATYDIRRLDQDPNPQAFHVDAAVVKVIFDLAAKLDDFHGVDLSVRQKGANLGEKTFRYEKGGQVSEVTFTSTRDKTATELLVIFSSIARQEGDLADLMRAMQYEPLGVNDALLQIESDYDLFLEPRQFLPTLDKVAADDRIIEIARRRARALATRIRLGH